MQNQGFDAWGIVWLIVVGGSIAILLILRLVEWIRKPPSFSKKMSMIADRLSRAGLYGKVTIRVRVEDAWVEFIDSREHPEARVTVHDEDGIKFLVISCDMSKEAMYIFRKVLSGNGQELRFKNI